MKRTAMFLAFGLIAVLQARTAFGQSVGPMPDGMPTYEEFAAKIKKYPYTASSVRLAKIRTGLPKLTPCMTKTSVEELLGAPDYSRLSYGPKGPGEKWFGSSWTYYLSKESDLAKESDPTIHISFDTSDRAYWIIPQNIEGEKEIKPASGKCGT